MSASASHLSMPDVQGHRTAPISRTAVRKALEKVLASRGFLNDERLSRLLTFVVGRVVERGATDISEYLIADEVFQRRDSFDPRIDSIVRVEMRRLRAQLSAYCETEGRNDPVEIYFPRKGYVPAFRSRRRQRDPSRPSIGVLPLEDLGVDPSQEYFAEGLTDTLITELAKLDGVRVISRTTMMQYKRWARHGSTRYLWTKKAISAAVHHVVCEQGEPLAVLETPVCR